ncbi:MAG: EAL domain-containing protein [Desulfuromonas sp.]|nr:EAL domain-containing protein [Desulfuromonas sp.]
MQRQPHTTETIKNPTNSKRMLVQVFISLVMLVGLSSLFFYHYQKHTIIAAAETNLSMLANLKSRQVGHWRHERIVHARLLTANLDLLNSVEKYFSNPTPSARQHIIRTLTPALSDEEDHAIILTDIEGNPQLDVGTINDIAKHINPAQLKLALQRRQVMFSKLDHLHSELNDPAHSHAHAAMVKTHVHMNLVVPLYRNNQIDSEVLGALVFVINPDHFLIPLITSWPGSSPSAESVLARKIDDHVLRLTPTRHSPSQESMVTALPPTDSVTPGSYIQNEQEGILDGYDYRNAAVLAAVKKVVDTPWFLIAKIDKAEVMQPLRNIALFATSLGLLILAVTGTMLTLWWRHQQALYQADYYQQQLQHRMLSERFDNLTRFANDIILLCNEDGDIIDANERAIEAYGYAPDDLHDKSIRNLCDMSAQDCDQLWEQLNQEEGVRFDSLQFHRDGSTFPVEISARWIKIDGRKLLQAIIRDISERKEAEQQLIHQAYHDPLTSLPNRMLINDRLRQAIAKAQRHKTQTAVLFLDLDRFKNINDTLGHAVGDQLLMVLAKRMEEALRDTDTVARFGGDEFLVLIEDIHNISDIAALAAKLSETITQPVFVDDHEMCVTTSIGISISPDDGSDVEQLIRFADTAMYRAKESGRNNFQFYTSDMNAHAGRRLKLENDLRKALERQEMVVYYQPQVDLHSDRIVGSEALIRWQHHEHGLIPPNDFIPLAEETGVINEIGAWVLEQSCRQNQLWQQSGHPDLKIAVNLSARQFRNNDLANEIIRTLARTGLEPRYLELELTESLLMHDVEMAIVLMEKLNKQGISLAIDDFGTGYSSLSHLNRFPIDKLKIDRSFVNNISSGDHGTIARSIISLAQALQLDIIAEGIETADQLDFLRQLNCPLGQGYYFSRPVTAEEFTALLNSSAAS